MILKKKKVKFIVYINFVDYPGRKKIIQTWRIKNSQQDNMILSMSEKPFL